MSGDPNEVDLKPHPDMGGWTIRNLPTSPHLAKRSPTPLAGSVFVHLNRSGESVNIGLTERAGATGLENRRIARVQMTPAQARTFAAALNAVADKAEPR